MKKSIFHPVISRPKIFSIKNNPGFKLLFSPDIKIKKIVCAVLILPLPKKKFPEKNQKKFTSKGHISKNTNSFPLFLFPHKGQFLIGQFWKNNLFSKSFPTFSYITKKFIFIFLFLFKNGHNFFSESFSKKLVAERCSACRVVYVYQVSYWKSKPSYTSNFQYFWWFLKKSFFLLVIFRPKIFRSRPNRGAPPRWNLYFHLV